MLNFCHAKIFNQFLFRIYAIIFILDFLEFNDLFDRAIYVNYSLKRDSKTLILYSLSAYGLIIRVGVGIFVRAYTTFWFGI